MFWTTILHVAAYYGQLDVCRLLLDWGEGGYCGQTSLHEAGQCGHLSVVKLLVERGADVRLKNDNGQTASDLARSEGRQDVAEWLDEVSCG
jgi:ankyrin repeat protein